MGSYEHATTTGPETRQQVIDRLEGEMSPAALQFAGYLDDKIIGAVSDRDSGVSPSDIPKILEYVSALNQPNILEEEIHKADLFEAAEIQEQEEF